MKAQFSIASLGRGCLALNDNGRTVAVVTSRGYVDWLMRSPADKGRLVNALTKETHLSFVQGLKFNLAMPHLTDAVMTKIEHEILEGGETAVLIGHAVSADKKFTSCTEAVAHVHPETGLYEWELRTVLYCRAEHPVELSWIEFNNIYPGKCGRCMLFSPEKEYHTTLMVDRDQTVWEFPHQHTMHYKHKINNLHFADGSMAGFFGEQSGSPVCVVQASAFEPDWAICDMYYDLHCGARPDRPLEPGGKYTWRYTVKYLTPEQSRPLIQQARPVPVTDEDWQTHTCPRLELGMNHFDRPVAIDSIDDASAFRQAPPKRVWDRNVGHKTKGSLRISHDQHEETVWSAVPPTQIPADSEFVLSALVKVQQTSGKGVFLRVRYHTFEWDPTPHVEWTQTLCSSPVTGHGDTWVRVTVPKLCVPKEHVDYLVWIDVVFEGKGTVWVTDVDVDLIRVKSPVLFG